MAVAMARRPVNPSRRVSESVAPPFASSLRSRSRSHPCLLLALILGGFLLIRYFYRGQGTSGASKILTRVEGDFSCTSEVQQTIPILKTAYGDSMHRVLHVGPDSCSVVSRLLREKDTEAWGVEPYDIEDADRTCKSLVHKGFVRVADIKFPLPYRKKSFSLVIVSDALDYLSPRYLNRTLPELARIAGDGLVIFTGYPHHRKVKVADKAKNGRSAKFRSLTWWMRYFVQTSLEENAAIVKKFEQAAAKRSYTPSCQIFHLNSYS
ncbi:probable pectin methylesterase CGR3 [Primulina eburnea]|uniref:probable pectin methylesterase CGR3 n=1 Tax=Primulina eburnea TaxID=1245227 RepID=UPI003C6BE978